MDALHGASSLLVRGAQRLAKLPAGPVIKATWGFGGREARPRGASASPASGVASLPALSWLLLDEGAMEDAPHGTAPNPFDAWRDRASAGENSGFGTRYGPGAGSERWQLPGGEAGLPSARSTETWKPLAADRSLYWGRVADVAELPRSVKFTLRPHKFP
jgi:hypothetical protein